MVKSSGARAQVRLDSGARERLSNSLKAASLASLPDRAFLRLENVRGMQDAQNLQVFVNEHSVGHLGLFGLRRASQPDRAHGGAGLTFVLDITDVIDTLHLQSGLAIEALDVKILPSGVVYADSPISVGRVSVYRETHK